MKKAVRKSFISLAMVMVLTQHLKEVYDEKKNKHI